MGTKVVRGLKHMTYQERLASFSLGKEGKGSISLCCPLLMGRYGEDGGRLFLEMRSKRRIDNTSCNKGNSDWEQGKNLPPTKVVKHRNELSREVVESVLGDFQTQLSKSLCNLI